MYIISWCIDLSKILNSTPQISESIPFLFGLGTIRHLFLSVSSKTAASSSEQTTRKREKSFLQFQGPLIFPSSFPPPPHLIMTKATSLRFPISDIFFSKIIIIRCTLFIFLYAKMRRADKKIVITDTELYRVTHLFRHLGGGGALLYPHV